MKVLTFVHNYGLVVTIVAIFSPSLTQCSSDFSEDDDPSFWFDIDGIKELAFPKSQKSVPPAPAPAPPSHRHRQQDYVDFGDMGSYQYETQSNRYTGGQQHSTELLPSCFCPGPPGVLPTNDSYVMSYLKRVVASLIRQTNVKSHVFGPGESITIDLRAEMSHDDLMILTRFLDDREPDPTKYLNYVDLIVSNLLNVIEAPPKLTFLETVGEIMHWVLSGNAVHAMKVFLVTMSAFIYFYACFTLLKRAIRSSHSFSMMAYLFTVLFLVSCAWMYFHLYQMESASRYSRKLANPPPECDWDKLSTWDTIKYYFFPPKVSKGSDRCELYYIDVLSDPMMGISPLEAVMKTAAVIVFSWWGYAGHQIGESIDGILHKMPWYMKPFVLLAFPCFIILFCGLYRVRTPFFSIEPSPAVAKALEPPAEPKNVIIQRPELPVVHVSTRDAATDMDDFQAYLDSLNQNESPNN